MRYTRHLLVLALVAAVSITFIAPSRVKAIVYGFVDTNNDFKNAGAFIVKEFGGESSEEFLVKAIGCALLFTAATYTLRMHLQLRMVTMGNEAPPDTVRIRPIPTVLVGAFGGLLVFGLRNALALSVR